MRDTHTTRKPCGDRREICAARSFFAFSCAIGVGTALAIVMREVTVHWTFRIARIAGIDVHVHATLLLLFVWIAISSYAADGGATAALYGVGVGLGAFTMIALHELGHALVAARFGIRTHDITLYPIGGVARLDRLPERPAQEIAVAIAGPAVNVTLAVLIGVVLTALDVPLVPDAKALSLGAPIAVELVWINVGLALFNVIPAFPMDGGRVLRALLATRMDYVRATELAALVGRVFAVGLATAGLFYSATWVIIALFVWIAGTAEASAVEARAILRRLPVRAAMRRDVHTIAASATQDEAAREMLRTGQPELLVLDDGQIVGVVTHAHLMSSLLREGPRAPLEHVLERELVRAAPDEPIEGVLSRIPDDGCRTVPVVERGQLVGLLTPESLAEVVFLDRAASGPRTDGASTNAVG